MQNDSMPKVTKRRRSMSATCGVVNSEKPYF